MLNPYKPGDVPGSTLAPRPRQRRPTLGLWVGGVLVLAALSCFMHAAYLNIRYAGLIDLKMKGPNYWPSIHADIACTLGGLLLFVGLATLFIAKCCFASFRSRKDRLQR